MMNREKIVPLTVGKVRELAEIYVRAYRTRGEQWTRKRARGLLMSYLKKQPDMALIAISNGKVVGGFLCLIRPWWDGNHLVETEIFVDPKTQKAGIGKKLFLALLTKAKKKYRASIIEGITFATLGFPMSWYKRIGLRKSKKLMFIDGEIDAILRRLK